MRTAQWLTGMCFLVLTPHWTTPSPVRADGSVTGQFVLEGAIPKPKILFEKGAAVKDSEICAPSDFISPELVVDAKTKGIQNIFIYMRRAPAGGKITPSKKKEIVFDQKGCRFKPHALFVRTDQTVLVKSDDPVAHNTHTFMLRNQPVNILVAPNQRKGIPLKNPVAEILPMPVKCDLHPHMRAYWLILDHPFAAITDAKGGFEIKGLPAGEHEFRVWHERVGYINRKFKVQIKDGKTTTLDAVKVPVATLSN
ncbi:MAG: hypothetical protein ABGZ17_12880 [Planctomycetaceae bacterium]